jgi:hypothetical protein
VKVGDLIEISSASEGLILGVIMPEDPDTIWVSDLYVWAYIMEGPYKGQIVDVDKRQASVISESR